MSEEFTVTAKIDSRNQEEHGVPYVVLVRSSENPDLAVHMRLLQVFQSELTVLRILWAQLTCEDEEGTLHQVLTDVGWWGRALEAVLEHIVFNSTAVEHAIDDHDGLLLYGWEGGDVLETNFECDLVEAESEPEGTPPSMAWASDVFASEPKLTKKQVDRFFDDLSLMLLQKAFEDRSNDAGSDDGGKSASPDSEGGDR